MRRDNVTTKNKEHIQFFNSVQNLLNDNQLEGDNKLSKLQQMLQEKVIDLPKPHLVVENAKNFLNDALKPERDKKDNAHIHSFLEDIKMIAICLAV